MMNAVVVRSFALLLTGCVTTKPVDITGGTATAPDQMTCQLELTKHSS